MHNSVAERIARILCDATNVKFSVSDITSSSSKSPSQGCHPADRIALYDQLGNSLTVYVDGDTLIERFRNLYTLIDAHQRLQK